MKRERDQRRADARTRRGRRVLAAGLALCALLVAVTGTQAARQAPHAHAAVRPSGRDAGVILRRRSVRLRLSGQPRARLRVIVTLSGTVPRRPNGRLRAASVKARAARSVRLGPRGRATIAVRLHASGRKLLRSALGRCSRVSMAIRLVGRHLNATRHLRLSLGRGCARRHQIGLGGVPHTPAGGFPPTGAGRGSPATFRVGAAVGDFSPPAFGRAAGGDAADCDPSKSLTGVRGFAFEEPYQDVKGDGHYDGPSDATSLLGFPPSPSGGAPFPGDPYVDCNHNGRWEGNLLGGGGGTPRFYSRVADAVSARAMVVSNGQRTIAVEVVDQEGLFNVYQQQIRDRVAADGYHLDGIFISATHDESAPDTLGLGGVNSTTSGTNDYFVAYLVEQSAQAIERAYQAMRPATVRYTEVLEPSNLRQCWSSYPYVDDQHIPVLQAVGLDGKPIVTLASVSQHAETLGFNGGSQALDDQKRWVSADWPSFFRSSLEQHFGGVGIEMAGSVGSVESPEVYAATISRTPQQFIDASHPAGCRTLFDVGGQQDSAGTQHVPLGYNGETQAFGDQMAATVIRALDSHSYSESVSGEVWGARASVCVPVENTLFLAAGAAGVFAHRPSYNTDCSVQAPVAANGSTTGTSAQTQVAAFQIGDGQFISVPGEVFPFTYLRGFLGPQDMPSSSAPLPPWLLPHMHSPFRFIDGLGEDMIGYIFPQGNAVGIPTQANPTPSGDDRFGCHHSDDSEAASSRSGDLIGNALVPLLDAHGGRPETIAVGRYVLPDGTLSRDPLGGPQLKCGPDSVFHPNGAASAVELADGSVVHPSEWMSLSGTAQIAPDRDTRGYVDPSGRRVWLDVYPDVSLP